MGYRTTVNHLTPLYVCVERLGLDCKVEYTNANQGTMSESDNIWFQYTECDLNNTFQGQVPSLPLLYFS
jgi:hypothetical protein